MFEVGLRKSRDDNRPASRNNDSVLVLGGQAAILGLQGPAVVSRDDLPGAHGQKRFDRDDQPFDQALIGRGQVEPRHAGLLVEAEPNTVAGHITDDGKPQRHAVVPLARPISLSRRPARAAPMASWRAMRVQLHNLRLRTDTGGTGIDVPISAK